MVSTRTCISPPQMLDRLRPRGTVTDSLDRSHARDRWLDTGDVVLRYRTEGAGAPVVLIHELGGTLESWDDVAHALSSTHRVIRYDQRCAGASEKTSEPFDVHQLAEDLLALFHALGVTEPVHLVGAAFGAAPAAIIAADHPDAVASVTMLSPALDITDSSARFAIARAELADEQGMRAIESATFERAWPPDRRPDKKRFARHRSRYLGADPHGFALHNRALAAVELNETIARIQAPTLVVGGRYDLVRPSRHIRQQASTIARARFVELDAAHFMAVEAPQAVSVALLEFLDEITTDRPASPRLSDSERDDLSTAQRNALAEAVAGARGRVPAPMRAWIASPEFARRAQALGETLRFHTSLPRRLSELAILITARIWRSEYEWKVHAKAASDAGIEATVIERIRAGTRPTDLTDAELTVVEVALQLHFERQLAEQTFDHAQRVLGPAGLAELIGLLGYYTLVSMTLNAYEIGLMPGPRTLFAQQAAHPDVEEIDD